MELKRTRMLCTLHNLEYEAVKLAADKPYTDCPACAEREIRELHERLSKSEKQRDLLLAVIELKRTSIPTANHNCNHA